MSQPVMMIDDMAFDRQVEIIECSLVMGAVFIRGGCHVMAPYMEALCPAAIGSI